MIDSLLQAVDYWVSVHSLQTSSEGSLLDPDDTLLDVVDDREQVGFPSWGRSVLPAHEKMSSGIEISNNLVCATSKGSDQPALIRSLIRAFACRLNIL